MRVAPGGKPQSQPSQAPGGPPQAGGQGPSPAEQAVKMIQEGYMMLGKMIQSAGSQLPPDDIKLFQTAAQATDALLQSLTGGSGSQGGPQEQPEKAPPGGPMPQNANAQAQPASPQ